MKILIKIKNKDDFFLKKAYEILKDYQYEFILEKDFKDYPNKNKVDILITNNLSLSELNELNSLKYIFCYKTGIENFPCYELKKRNISLVPSFVNANQIAEHALALALNLTHRISEFDRDLRKGIWYSNTKDYFWESFSSLNIGIFGFGHIGKEIAKKVTGLVNKIYIYNRSNTYGEYSNLAVNNLDELIKFSDLIFICIPLNEKNYKIFNHYYLDKMRNKYIINISRAELFDEALLFSYLKNRMIKGYASDAWFKSPDKFNKAKTVKASKYDFDSLKNVIMTPHSGTHFYGGHENYILDSLKNCAFLLKNLE